MKYFYLGNNKITAVKYEQSDALVINDSDTIEVIGEHKWEKHQILEEEVDFKIVEFMTSNEQTSNEQIAVPIEEQEEEDDIYDAVRFYRKSRENEEKNNTQ